jgi:hypothetical protein
MAYWLVVLTQNTAAELLQVAGAEGANGHNTLKTQVAPLQQARAAV